MDPQITVTKSYRTCTAHYLDRYVGKCANLHGHNYLFKVSVQLTGPDLRLDNADMLTDFGSLKEFCKICIEPWDHALITPMSAMHVRELITNPGYQTLLGFWGIRDKYRVFGFGENPTAEAMSRHLGQELRKMIEAEILPLPQLIADDTQCNVYIEVWETEDSMASYACSADLEKVRESRAGRSNHALTKRLAELSTQTAPTCSYLNDFDDVEAA